MTHGTEVGDTARYDEKIKVIDERRGDKVD